VFASVQPFARIQSITVVSGSVTTTYALPLPPSVQVTVPNAGSATLTVKVAYRKTSAMKVIGLLNDQDLSALADLGPTDGANCVSGTPNPTCITFTLDTAPKAYDLEVQVVDSATPANVRVSTPGPSVSTITGL